MKNKTVIFFTCYPFPNGVASTNRILGYCKGLIRNGYKCEVICFRPTEKPDNIVNRSTEGIYNDIEFMYPGKITIRSSKFLLRRINDFKSLVISVRKLREVLRNRNVTFVIFYGKNFLAEVSTVIVSKLSKIPIYKEENENPHIFFRNCHFFLCKMYEHLYINYVYRLYDKILVMTNPLIDFFLKIGIRREALIYMPQFVDIDKYKHTNVANSDAQYIAYAGSLDERKDGVLTLIKAFHKISKKYQNISLKIAGFGIPSEMALMNNLIKELGLESRINFLGCVQSKDMPDFLRNAKMLISCRPRSLQSEYGFPTKIAEYLASGKPTVTTSTGELHLFLKDNKNAFIIDDLSTDGVASKISHVLDNYDHALQVAQEGYALVCDQFDPAKHTKCL